jgi:hypothetical protein
MEKLRYNHYHGCPRNYLASLFRTKTIPFIDLFKYRGCAVSFKYKVFQEFVGEDLSKQQTNPVSGNYRCPSAGRLSNMQTAPNLRPHPELEKMIKQFSVNLVNNITATLEY